MHMDGFENKELLHNVVFVIPAIGKFFLFFYFIFFLRLINLVNITYGNNILLQHDSPLNV